MKKQRHRISAAVWGTSALLVIAVIVFALR
jgi:hypothetical protein